MTDISEYGEGWAHFLGSRFFPINYEGECLQQWMMGFCAAQADYDLEPSEYESIQAALIGRGIKGDLLARCLAMADRIESSESPIFIRWPGVPIRPV